MFEAKRMLKHSSIYAFGNLSRQLVGFVMLPVYTRYLSPADYGVVGLLIFMVTLIELVFGARLFHAVPKFFYEQKDERSGHDVISTALIITSSISAMAVLGVIVFRNPISQLIFGAIDHGLVVGIFSVLILTQALENYGLGYVRIQQRPWLFVAAGGFKLFMQLGLNILLVVVMKKGVLGVALASAISAIVFAVAITLYVIWYTGMAFRQEMAKKLIIFSWPLWFSGLAALYIGSSNRYYLRLFGSLEEVGLFELATKFGSMIAILVWMPFSMYWQTVRFDLYNQPNPIPLYQNVYKFVTTLLMLAGLGIALFSGPAIRIMATEEFHIAAKAVPWLMLSSVFQCLVFFVNFSFLIKERTGWISGITYVSAIASTGFYLLLIPKLGFVGAAQGLMLAHAFQFVASHYGAKRHYDMQLSLRGFTLQIIVVGICVAVADNTEQVSVVNDILVKSAIFVVGSLFIVAPLLSSGPIRDYLLSLLNTKAIARSR